MNKRLGGALVLGLLVGRFATDAVLTLIVTVLALAAVAMFVVHRRW